MLAVPGMRTSFEVNPIPCDSISTVESINRHVILRQHGDGLNFDNQLRSRQVAYFDVGYRGKAFFHRSDARQNTRGAASYSLTVCE